jgi:hypothetical protein
MGFRSHRGPEGRPLNVSPARKGWIGIAIVIPSAIGAALMLSSTNLRRGDTADVEAPGHGFSRALATVRN